MAYMFQRAIKRGRKSFRWLRGWFHAHITLRILCYSGLPIRNVNLFERKIPFIERIEYAQNFEDGIIHAIFAKIKTTNKFFVEFGAENGIQCNSRYLSKHKGWKGLLMDGGHKNSSINLQKEFITKENIEELFEKYSVPKEFDLLSIDIDGNDYWVWQAITHYSPRVVIIEYNACHPWNTSKTIPYDAEFIWDKTDYYGATLQAMVKLGAEKGYTLVATDSHGVNAFFVQDAIAKHYFQPTDPQKLYHPAAFKGKKGLQHPPDTIKRSWVHI